MSGKCIHQGPAAGLGKEEVAGRPVIMTIAPVKTNRNIVKTPFAKGLRQRLPPRVGGVPQRFKVVHGKAGKRHHPDPDATWLMDPRNSSRPSVMAYHEGRSAVKMCRSSLRSCGSSSAPAATAM